MDNTKTAEEKPDFEALAYKKIPVKAYPEVWAGYVNGCEDVWKEHVAPLKKRIEELEAWIDCKERMPEPETVVLVSKLYGVGSRQTLMSFTTKKFPDLFDCFSGDKITHWKPVPEFKL